MAVATGSTLTHYISRVVKSTNERLVSYLFRMSGQALGVSLSGALVQGVLTNQLRKKITGPGSYEVCVCVCLIVFNVS